MTDYIITTDSGCDFAPDHYDKYGVIPYYMEYEADGKMYKDDPSPEKLLEFYDRMRAGVVVKTTQINTECFKEFFTGLVNEHKKPIMHISLSSGLSGTYNNARLAAQDVMKANPDAKIYVIDSLGASFMMGLLCVRASENRKNGMGIEENVKDIEDIRLNVNVYFTTSDLTYLHRGGRVSKTSAVIGGMLGINPILSVDTEGKLYALTKARGEKATVAKIEQLIESNVENAGGQTLYFCHSDCFSKAKAMADRFKDKFGFRDTMCSSIGSIIGAHTGPGLSVFFYLGKTRPEQ